MSIYLTRDMLDPNADPTLADRPGGGIRRWLRAAVTRWQRRRMSHALKRLDDRLLADIGLNRGNIGTLVDELDARELQMVPVAPAVSARAADRLAA